VQLRAVGGRGEPAPAGLDALFGSFDKLLSPSIDLSARHLIAAERSQVLAAGKNAA
jgi:hypothetical protein